MGQDNRPVRETLPGRALKTVIITRNAYDWQYGGAERFCFNLARTLADEGVRPVIVTRVPELLAQCAAHGIITFRNVWLQNETHRRWAPAYYLLYPILVAQYAYVILRYRASAVLLGSRDDQIFGTIAAWLTRRAAVWIDHADMKGIVAQPFRFMNKSYYWALRHARRVIAVSAAEQTKIFTNLPEAFRRGFVVINNGASLSPATPLKRPSDRKVVLFVGRIEQDKGIFDLAASARAIHQTHQDVEFWLVGKGQAEAEARGQLDDLIQSGHVKLLGHLDNVASAMLAADIFVYPTHHDASPLAPVEAMQAGLPVVATLIGGIPEVVTPEAGILVDAMRPEALTAAVTRLLDDPALYVRLKDGALAQGKALDFAEVTRQRYIPLLREAAAE